MATFRCGLEPSEGLSFSCYLGSTCSNSTIYGPQACVCAEGFEHDYVGFGHFPNCTLRKGFMLGFFISYTVTFVVLLWFAVLRLRRSNIQGRLRKIAKTGIAWSIVSWFHIVAVFCENGFYEASLVTFLGVCGVGFVLSYHCSILLFEPILTRIGFADSAKHFKKISAFGTILINLTSTGLTGALIYHCRDEDPRIYNALMLVMLFSLITVLFIQLTYLIYSTLKLKQLLPREAESLIKQLHTMFVFYMLLVVVAAVTFTLLSVWASFASIPFMYVQWAICQCLVLLLMAFIQPLMKNVKRSDTKRTTTIEKSGEEVGSLGGDQPDNSLALGLMKKKKLRLQSKKKIPKMTRITELEESGVQSLSGDDSKLATVIAHANEENSGLRVG